MLPILNEFRKTLDDIMLQAMHERVLLWGYESYTGRFLKWYAEYYHSIKIDYLLSTDMSRGRAYDQEIFRPGVLNMHYRDLDDAVIWLAEPMTDELREILIGGGYEERVYFDFYQAIYGSDVYGTNDANVDIFRKKKEGRRDIQFLEWLEWKYGCNFVTRISKELYEVKKGPGAGAGYGCSTQKEIFPMLDHCHCIPQVDDAIFDFGCGKGGALVSFLDYGFHRVGGVEYEPKIYEVLKENMSRLGLESKTELLYGDAGELTEELDKYNWIYLWQPFPRPTFEKVVKEICESYRRKNRKIHLIYVGPTYSKWIEQVASDIFRLTNQFTVDMRSRVVDIFESY